MTQQYISINTPDGPRKIAVVDLGNGVMGQAIHTPKSNHSEINEFNVDWQTPVRILEANPHRNGFLIHNHGDSKLIIAYNDQVGPHHFTQVMGAHALLDYSSVGVWTGEVWALRWLNGEMEPVLVTSLLGDGAEEA
jgi:hypothetical protein